MAKREIKEYSPKLGDESFNISIEDNLLINAKYFIESYLSNTYKYYHMRFISLAIFYELLFKYKLKLISPFLIYSKPEEFDEEKYVTGEFVSIKAYQVFQMAKKSGWIDENEFTLIKMNEDYRNKLVHFSVTEQDYLEDDNTIRVELLKDYYWDKQFNLVRKLLMENKSLFEGYYYFSEIEKILSERESSNNAIPPSTNL